MKTNRLMQGWTKTESLVVLATAFAVLGASAANWSGGSWASVAIPVLVLLTFTAGLAFDPFVATLVGLGAAALVIWLKQLVGVWSEAELVTSALQVVLILFTAGVAGMAGRHLRAHAPRGDVLSGPEELYPAFGSLGLLHPDLGEARLEEEIDRAGRYERPVAVLRLATEPTGEEPLGARVADAIERTSARVIESLLRVTDVPFAYEGDCIVALLPETDRVGAERLAERIEEALSDATFVIRPEGTRLCLADYAHIRIGIAAYPEDGRTVSDLLHTTSKNLTSYLPTSGEERRWVERRPDAVSVATTPHG